MKRLYSIALVALLAAPTLAAAQSSAPWLAYAGCWEPVAGAALELLGDAPPIVCVTPDGAAATLTSLEGGAVVGTHTLVPGAGQREFDRGGCAGTEQEKWSADGRRLYLSVSVQCEGGSAETRSGVFAFDADGDWIEIRAGELQPLSVARYRSVPVPGHMAELAAIVDAKHDAIASARRRAGLRYTAADVIEASHALEPRLLEALLIERGSGFALNASVLQQLAAAGVPGTTTDVMIAVSYPGRFSIAGGEPEPQPAPIAAMPFVTTGRSYSPWGWGAYSNYDQCYGYNRASYNRSFLGSSRGCYERDRYVSWYNRPPTVVVGQQGTKGRVVKGHGYTRTTEAARPASNGRNTVVREAAPKESSGSSGGERRAKRKE